jgi:hypothetical protein
VAYRKVIAVVDLMNLEDQLDLDFTVAGGGPGWAG